MLMMTCVTYPCVLFGNVVVLCWLPDVENTTGADVENTTGASLGKTRAKPARVLGSAGKILQPC